MAGGRAARGVAKKTVIFSENLTQSQEFDADAPIRPEQVGGEEQQAGLSAESGTAKVPEDQTNRFKHFLDPIRWTSLLISVYPLKHCAPLAVMMCLLPGWSTSLSMCIRVNMCGWWRHVWMDGMESMPVCTHVLLSHFAVAVT